MGDPAGIGGEIILKALPHITKKSIPIVIGDLKVLESLRHSLPSLPHFSFKGPGLGRPGDAEFIDLDLAGSIRPGFSDARCGDASYRYIIEALKFVFTGEAAAIVTCPISKASLNLAGIPFPGHTELLARMGSVDSHVMMLANPSIRVSLVTIHIPLARVPQQVTSQGVFHCIRTTWHSLRDLMHIPRPSVKVLGLNPHAGEQGTIGLEERLIEEAVSQAQSMGMDVTGPYPADSVFHHIDCDAYVAMYHDQGLIPVKTVDFERTVNITLGLPFVRTSPGHGTGFDIAGKGTANPSSFIEAYRTAEMMAGV